MLFTGICCVFGRAIIVTYVIYMYLLRVCKGYLVTYVIYMYMLRVCYGFHYYLCHFHVYVACFLGLSVLLMLFTCLCCVIDRAFFVTIVLYMYMLRVCYCHLCYLCYLQVYVACLIGLSLLLMLFTCLCCVLVTAIFVTYVIYMYMLRVC